MRVITAYSHKGGTGKTTALMMLASAIEASGKTALLVDCDPHRAFAAYQVHSRTADRDFWSPRLEVVFCHYELEIEADLQNLLYEADESGKYDYCLINLAGVDHPFNRHVLRFAEMTLLPFAPAALDLMELPGALAVMKTLEAESAVGLARIVFTKMKGRLTAAQQQYRDDVVAGFPHLETEIPDTSIFADLVMRGLLGRSLAFASAHATGLQLAEVKRLREALNRCQALLTEIDNLIDEDASI